MKWGKEVNRNMDEREREKMDRGTYRELKEKKEKRKGKEEKQTRNKDGKGKLKNENCKI